MPGLKRKEPSTEAVSADKANKKLRKDNPATKDGKYSKSSSKDGKYSKSASKDGKHSKPAESDGAEAAKPQKINIYECMLKLSTAIIEYR